MIYVFNHRPRLQKISSFQRLMNIICAFCTFKNFENRINIALDYISWSWRKFWCSKFWCSSGSELKFELTHLAWTLKNIKISNIRIYVNFNWCNQVQYWSDFQSFWRYRESICYSSNGEILNFLGWRRWLNMWIECGVFMYQKGVFM